MKKKGTRYNLPLCRFGGICLFIVLIGTPGGSVAQGAITIPQWNGPSSIGVTNICTPGPLCYRSPWQTSNRIIQQIQYHQQQVLIHIQTVIQIQQNQIQQQILNRIKAIQDRFKGPF